MDNTIYMNKRLTPTQKEFLKLNYPLFGGKYCSEKLKVPSPQIRNYCFKHDIKVNADVLDIQHTEALRLANITRQNKPHNEYAVNPDQFLTINSPEIAYILGFVWADGYLYDNSVKVECITKDLSLIKDTFKSTGNWFVNYRNRENRQPQMCIGTHNKIIYDFLTAHDYISKSEKSADKILSKIPEHLQYYWFRGLVDGDGCFYINNKLNLYQFSIASSYNQDWTYVEHIFQELNIKYAIKRRKQLQHGKLNGSSVIRITNQGDIIKFGNYIYKNYNLDKIGLPRKYNKFKLILDSLK